MAESSSHIFTEARLAGLSPIPVDTTTKRPLVRWSEYQDKPADELRCAEWDEAGLNLAIVCGEVSGRLICLDFEGPFFDRAIYIDPPVHALLTLWSRGYMEETPSGGRHILIRVEGEGPLEGNRKIASDRNGKTLIETRAEGGYVIVAPSRNGHKGWELQRGGFDSIEWATEEEYFAVVAGLGLFDESPPPTTVVPTSTAPPILRLGESWIESVKADLPPFEHLLTQYGWVQARSRDSYGQHWVRPGKDPREGHSASLSTNGYLYVHSTNAGLPVGLPSLDQVDFILSPSLGRRPTMAERVAWMESRRVAPPLAVVVGPAGPVAETFPAADSVRLSDDFWQSTEVLASIHAAAVGRMLAPTAVLGAFLSSYAATIPMSIWVPPIVGRASPLNMYCCVVGRSGSGKSAAMGVAEELLGWNASRNPKVLLAQSLRSGEGLARLAIIPAPKGSDEGPTYNDAIQVEFDEGGTLGKQSERAGSTTIQYLNQGWSGRGHVGGAKAGEISQFPAWAVRICVVMGIQFGAAANLFTGDNAAQGFPQRLMYFDLSDPSLATMPLDRFGNTEIEPVPTAYWPHREYSRGKYLLRIPAHICDEVKAWSQQVQHGTGLTDRLDGHQMLLQLRLASVFALMRGEFEVSDLDWNLSAQISDVSRSVRRQLVNSMAWAEKAKKDARKAEHLELHDALNLHKLEAIAQRIKRFLEAHDGCNWTKLRRNCFVTGEVGLREEVLAYGEHRGWFIHRDGGYYLPHSE